MHNGFGNARWHRAGEVYVDSGTIMVVDPCYVLRDHRDEDKGTDNGLEYFHAMGLDLPDDHPRSPNKQHESLARGDMSVLKLPDLNGYVIPSGYGDGAYPIFVKVHDEGDWGHRIGGVYIDFGLGPDYDEDDDEPYDLPGGYDD